MMSDENHKTTLLKVSVELHSLGVATTVVQVFVFCLAVISRHFKNNNWV